MLSVLARLEMFQGIGRAHLAALTKQGQKRTFRAGSQPERQEDLSRSLHIILKGRVQIERSHPDILEPVVLAEMGPGEVVAGLGVLNGDPRSASLTALEDTDTLELDASALAHTVLQCPEVSEALLHALSRGLRGTDALDERVD
jgi:CRP/FNR family transcriptional regulator, cyclic AMP receptor protein